MICKHKLITILGPTATGKTSLAAHLAYEINGEIISSDSRQVYRGMTIGTGKDLNDFIINEKKIPHHLIDILDAGGEYNVFEFLNDFHNAFNEVILKEKTPIMCGGSGMYLESVLKGYTLLKTPIDNEYRESLNKKTYEELIEILSKLKKLHNKSDISSRERLIRALEISGKSEDFNIKNSFPKIESDVYGIYFDREIIKKRITERLVIRLKEGMIDEVKQLLENGITIEKLKYYGLEYKFIAMYLENEITYEEMFEKLNIAIHQFSKRQMTWFRKMEKNGIKINWIDGNFSINEKINYILNNTKN